MFVVLLCAALAAEQPAATAPPTPEQLRFFENHVRPVLVERCPKCHGDKKQWAGLRLDSRDALLNRIYANQETAVVDRAIDVHVGKVREKLGDDPTQPRFIATVRGVGYKLL